MMRRFLALIILTLALAAGASQPKWEAVESARRYAEQLDIDAIDVYVKEGCVYLTTRKPVNVKVLTILGQLITQDSLAPGVHRLKIPTKGIYILKVGEVTRRITV